MDRIKGYLDHSNVYAFGLRLDRGVVRQIECYNTHMNFTIHTDGGARGNPGPAAIGVVIEPQTGEVLTISKYIGATTNNVAEYTAVIEALEKLNTAIPKESRGVVQFLLDSLLVVCQLTGKYKIKNMDLFSLSVKIKKLEKEWGSRVMYQHIPRAENAAADKLVNQALDLAAKQR